MGWVVKKPTAIEVEPNRLKPYSKRFSAGLRGGDDANIRHCIAIALRGNCPPRSSQRRVRRSNAIASAGGGSEGNTSGQTHTYTKYYLARFLDALVEAGAAKRPKVPKKAPTAFDRLVAEYEAYLREQRGLTQSTIYHCVHFLHRFVAFRFGGKLGDMNAITAEDIARFLEEASMATASPAPFRPILE
jgi:integrase/recombinase XerD